ncbi:MAG TPA: hypothetical protein VF483_09270 [Gemmatimonadaceae bacterium]
MPDSRPPRGGKSKGDADKTKGRASVERAMALRDVMSHAVEVEKDLRKASGPRNESGAGRGVMLALSMCLLAFTVYAYAAKPEFVFGADPNNVSEVRRDANLRFTMFLLSRRVETIKNRTHRLPDNLATIPGAPKGVTYARLTDSVFELRGKENGKDVVFRSDESAEQFLGQSPKILSGRGQ